MGEVENGTLVSHRWRGVVEEFHDLLGIEAGLGVVTLREGGTPLLEAPRLSARVGADVLVKVEGANPTGSFKDRGMTLAVSRAKAAGARMILCASTGNTSASAAAYAARAGLTCGVVVPSGHVARGKLAQSVHHGTRVALVQGSFDEALAIVRRLGRADGIALVNSVNPDRIAGQRSAAFELAQSLGAAPDLLCLPVGNAGNITAYWQGFRLLREAGRVSRLPRLLGAQAAGAAPMVLGAPVEHPRTVASAIRIGRPASAESARSAVAECGGRFVAVEDEKILDAYRFLAESEGIFCEPASAAPVAALLEHGAPAGSTVVCVLTGHGLKDPDTATSGVPALRPVAASLEAVAERLGL